MKLRHAFLHPFPTSMVINVALAVGSSLFTPALRAQSIAPGTQVALAAAPDQDRYQRTKTGAAAWPASDGVCNVQSSAGEDYSGIQCSGASSDAPGVQFAASDGGEDYSGPHVAATTASPTTTGRGESSAASGVR
jgi:hypothetical protein